MKRSRRSTLIKKLDKAFSLKVREIGVCVLKGIDQVKCGGVLQCAHIVGRANYRLRWDLQNVLCLCSGHHSYYTNHAWEWVGIIENQFPNKYVYVNQHRNEVIKYKDADLESKLQELL